MHRQPTTASQEEREFVYNAVILPISTIGLEPGYVLDVISTYANHQCHSRKGKHIFVSMAHPHLPLMFHSADSFTKWSLKSALEEHTLLVSRYPPNDAVKLVLGAALEKYHTKCRFKSIKMGTRYTIRAGFRELARYLAGEKDDY
jgi:hypothetical protein